MALPLPTDFMGEEAHAMGLFAQHQTKMMIKEHDLATAAGFSRPNASRRKFMWVHMPYNNPVWVKVRQTT